MTVDANREAVEAARRELAHELSWDRHFDSCPAHPDRVRNQGPCTCGEWDDRLAQVTAFEAAVRADEAARYAALVAAASWYRRAFLAVAHVAGEELDQAHDRQMRARDALFAALDALRRTE